VKKGVSPEKFGWPRLLFRTVHGYVGSGARQVHRIMEPDELEQDLGDGDQQALSQLLTLHRTRLRRMVESRMDRRLQGRIDPSDVIQEAYLEASTRLDTS